MAMDPLEIEETEGLIPRPSSLVPSTSSPSPPVPTNRWKAVSVALLLLILLKELSDSTLLSRLTPSPTSSTVSNPSPATIPPPNNSAVTPPSAPPSGDSLFNFYDNPATPRLTPEYSSHPHRDVPLSAFPATAWQVDDVYVNHFLEAGIALVDRTMGGIEKEYGNLDGLFDIQKIDIEAIKKLKSPANGEQLDRAVGYFEKSSFDGLTTRILHAMFTNDHFTVALGGHSSAAGHGNNFVQANMAQMNEVLEPLFDKLGVTFVARNMAMGSFGTMQSALAGGGVYGTETDVVVWDSMMTEGSNYHVNGPGGASGTGSKTSKYKGKKSDYIDLYFRQALISGNRAPFLLQHQAGCSDKNGNVCKQLAELHETTDADVGHLWYQAWELFDGDNMRIPKTDIHDPMKITKAVRWMNCGDKTEETEAWKEHKCEGVCWIDRDDVTPPKVQRDEPPSCVSWHPGWREHRYRGRVTAYYLLMATKQALKIWAEVVQVSPPTRQKDNPSLVAVPAIPPFPLSLLTLASLAQGEGSPLAVEYWHVGPSVYHVAGKTKALAGRGCEKIMESHFGPGAARVCRLEMTGVTEYTPRATYSRNLVELLAGVEASRKHELFEGPDGVVLESEAVEPGGVDVVRYAEGFDGGRRLSETASLDSLGWQVISEKAGECDGTVKTHCGRQANSDCILYGHHDGSGGLVGTTESKELEFTLGSIKGGFVAIHLELGVGVHEIECEMVEGGSGGKSVHTEHFKVVLDETQITGKLPAERRFFVKVWNDEGAKGGDYKMKLRVLQSARAVLTHIYWSIG